MVVENKIASDSEHIQQSENIFHVRHSYMQNHEQLLRDPLKQEETLYTLLIDKRGKQRCKASDVRSSYLTSHDFSTPHERTKVRECESKIIDMATAVLSLIICEGHFNNPALIFFNLCEHTQ
jgi:hypothetical protein